MATPHEVELSRAKERGREGDDEEAGRTRASIKEWERSFTLLRGRPPARGDVEAQPLVLALYRRYRTQQRLNSRPRPRPASPVEREVGTDCSVGVDVSSPVSADSSAPSCLSFSPPRPFGRSASSACLDRKRKRPTGDDDEYCFRPTSKTRSFVGAPPSGAKSASPEEGSGQESPSQLEHETLGTHSPPPSSQAVPSCTFVAGTDQPSHPISNKVALEVQLPDTSEFLPRSKALQQAGALNERTSAFVLSSLSAVNLHMSSSLLQRSLRSSIGSSALGTCAKPLFGESPRPKLSNSKQHASISLSRKELTGKFNQDGFAAMITLNNWQALDNDSNRENGSENNESLSNKLQQKNVGKKASTATSMKNRSDHTCEPVVEPVQPTITIKTAHKRSTGVSSNFVRLNLRRKTKGCSRAHGSARLLRHKAFRARRGCCTTSERNKAAQIKKNQISDAAFEELVDANDLAGYDSADDKQALRCFESSTLLMSCFDDKQAEQVNWLQELQQHFGLKTFREGQLEAIQYIMSGPQAAALLIQPTGHGKSLCYLLPATQLRLTLVISPLQALMFDQCGKLPKALPGRVWNSSCTQQEVRDIMSSMREGSIRVVFVSPEKAASASFRTFIITLPHLDLIVIDEAHCLTQWSYNFRPSYLYLRKFLSLLTRRPRILALTATATVDCAQDIVEKLHVAGLHVMRHGPKVRKNINIRIKRVLEDQKNEQVLEWIRAFIRLCSLGIASTTESNLLAGKCASSQCARDVIVYVTYRSQCDQLADLLRSHGISACTYHAGLAAHTRAQVQTRFARTSTNPQVIVATIAFGLGIDKPNIGLVIHTYLPSSLSAYTQEIGRAGRDGVDSHAWMCFSDRDELNQRSWLHKQDVEEGTLRRFLRLLSEPAALAVQQQPHHSPYVSISVEILQDRLEMNNEVTETLLTQLELHSNRSCLHFAGTIAEYVDITFRRPCSALINLINSTTIDSKLIRVPNVLLDHFSHLCTSNEADCAFKQVSLSSFANCCQWDMTDAMQALVTLRALGEVALKWSKSQVLLARWMCTVPSSESGQHQHDLDTLEHSSELIRIMKDASARASKLAEAHVDSLIAVVRLCERSRDQSETMHAWLDRHFSTTDAEFRAVLDLAMEKDRDHSNDICTDQTSSNIDLANMLRKNIYSLLDQFEAGENSSNTGMLTPQAIASILHGLSSPQLKKTHAFAEYWACCKHVDFEICRLEAASCLQQRRQNRLSQEPIS